MAGDEARLPESKNVVKEWLAHLSLSPSEKEEKTDATTGATVLVNECTEAGKKLDTEKRESVTVTYADGHEESVEMIISGTVDMGGSVLWSASNLGAGSATETGDHYAWGENKPKSKFTEDNYAYNGKNIGGNISGTWYDAARAQLGGDWRLPTSKEWSEFLSNTTNEFVSVNSVKGRLFKAKNGNLLFFPGNGYIYDETVGTPTEGFYWSANNSNNDNADVAYLPETSWGQSNYGKYIGLGIRPVKSK